MSRRNTIRTLIASFLLMLATGTLLVKSVHCVLIPHNVVELSGGLTVVSPDQPDSCPICSFDFFPVILHALKVLPDVSRHEYSERSFCLVTSPEKRVVVQFQLRAPPAA